jgi:hypothetical protein
MNDSDLRDLERAWVDSGSVEDETALLVARVRAGELASEQLVVACQLGHGASGSALLSLGAEAPGAEPFEWLQGPEDLEQDFAVRFVLAVVRTTEPIWRSLEPEGLRRQLTTRIRSAVESDLVPWLLGLGDPVADAIAARAADPTLCLLDPPRLDLPPRSPSVEARLALLPWRTQQARTTWIPEMEPGEGAPDAPRLGGAPWLAAGEESPRCGDCEEPLRLLLQLVRCTCEPDRFSFGWSGS